MLIEKSAGAIVFYPGERIEYLLLLSTYWGFPKGRIEAQEDERTAALREVREETGLEVAILEGWRQVDDYWYHHKGQRVHKQAVFFVAQAPSRESKISWEHEDMAWLPFDAALERLKFGGLKRLLSSAEEFVEKNKA